MRRAEHGHTTAATAALHCPLGVSMSTGAGGWGTAAACQKAAGGHERRARKRAPGQLTHTETLTHHARE
ncbi:hypothetical protein EMIHUDRAFT_356757 [Emiliania huxleyi CCMP1516]|uniref:Secreted protein n=2 Tax=Emiliania huxleyi TaxID=2903 RepID=A0A0D3IS79_EMIH1|nr:hypothetical protein EMIHUDRAFT_356757 [Emiliania huxleyi CCMP1516]EOD14114.1 hypothetical protein EMIHUDRAFT_356757 [Emiliania huxleyi CCMP1516]|eukprot:XP_005766543.1 hypothetical protein EMIHUDRAFT_356757 [Emiliania huxleyi CCMP1516]